MTDTTLGFDLRGLVVSVIEETDEADPGKIAEEVFDRIPKEDWGSALQLTLRTYVRQVVAISTSNTVKQMAKPSSEPQEAVTPRKAATAAKRNRMQRVGAFLALNFVGAGGVWKSLGKFTTEDMEYAAEERHRIAANTEAKAQQFDRWADLMKQYNVMTFGELPQDVLVAETSGEQPE